ncbi:MAG: right-handed parallel beta-helix repeat-containing protein [Burkholderiales bacterium]|nr:right-handed parallel beta-helix repeat-containing protein [Burkholderiales bacterium]
MNRRTVFRGAFAFVAALLLSATANAQLFRTYLAVSGNDANPCTLPQPCRLLPAALAAVADGGEIWLLGSANYNTATVSVTKSVTVLAVPGALGSVVATGGPAISIAAVGAKVALRNLVIVPLAGGGGTSGIVMSAGHTLVVEQSLLANLPVNGIEVTTAANVRIVDTTVREALSNAVSLSGGARATVTRAVLSGSGANGIALSGTVAGTTTTATVADSTLDGNNVGAFAHSTNATAALRLAVRDSRVEGNSFGLYALATQGATTTLVASGNIVTNSAFHGIAADGAGARVWATANTVSYNTTGITNLNGALFETTKSNAVRINAVDKSGLIGVVATE